MGPGMMMSPGMGRMGRFGPLPAMVALGVGAVESSMARLRLRRLPLLLASAFVMSALWVLWVLR